MLAGEHAGHSDSGKRCQGDRCLGAAWTWPPILAPWHFEAVWPWVSPSTSLSFRDSRELLPCPVLMPATHRLMIYVKGWALCLANGRYSGSDCNYGDARKSESSLSSSEASRRHRAKEAG